VVVVRKRDCHGWRDREKELIVEREKYEVCRTKKR